MRFWMFLGMWHQWRAAVWYARQSKANIEGKRELEWFAKILHEYHAGRDEELKAYCAARIFSVRYFDPKELP